MKTVACIIARTNSSRLPNKVLREVGGKLLIEHLIQRIKKTNNVDAIYLCTSTNPNDKILTEVALNLGIKSYTGSEDSVIDRMLDVAESEKADNVIRITGDNIFCDSVYIDLMVQYHLQNDAEYTRTEYLPIGTTAEVIKVSALKDVYKKMDVNFSQYLMLYMFNPDSYKCNVLIPPMVHRYPEWTLTVDTINDWERTCALFNNIEGFLSFDKIIGLIKQGKIPNYSYGSKSAVKLPAGITFNFASFKNEIELRISKSHTYNISLEEYNAFARKQI